MSSRDRSHLKINDGNNRNIQTQFFQITIFDKIALFKNKVQDFLEALLKTGFQDAS